MNRPKKRQLNTIMSPSPDDIGGKCVMIEDADENGSVTSSKGSDVTEAEYPCASGIDVLNDTQAHLTALQLVLAEKQSKVSKDQQLRIARNVSEVFRSVSQLLLERETMRADLATVTAQLRMAEIKIRHEKREKRHLEEKIIQLESDLGPVMRRVAVATEATLSFADIARKQPTDAHQPPPITQRGHRVGPPRPAVCIFPTDGDATKDSDGTKKIIEDIIRPSELGVRVTGIKKIRNKGILINTATASEQQKLLNAPCFDNSSKLKARLPSKRLPRLIFFNVPRDLTDEDFLRMALTGIPNIEDIDETIARCKLSHLAGARTGNACHRIYAVPATVRKFLVEQEKVFISWTICRVRDFIGLTVCAKCHMIGHSYKYCRDTKPTCGHCAQQNHTGESCPNSTIKPVCATCTRFGKPADHSTGDRDNCPAYIAALKNDLATIDYGV